MSDTIYIEGIRIFPPREGAPEFVKGNVIVTPNELIKFLKEQEEHASEYNGEKQFRMQLLEGRSGLYLSLDTFKPQKQTQQQETPEQNEEDDLPF